MISNREFFLARNFASSRSAVKARKSYGWYEADMPYWIQMPYHSDQPSLTKQFEIHGKDNYWPPYLAGYPLIPELRARLPDTLVIDPPKRRAMPDIFNIGHGGSPNDFVVNERVRQLIEGLEQGVHTFIPVKLREDKSGRVHDDYFMLYVGQAIDAVVIEQSDFAGGYGAEGYAKNPRLKLLGRHKVLDSQKIAGKHLWRGGIGKLGGGGDPNFSVLFRPTRKVIQVKEG